jgi:hypothetical protein
VTCFACQSRCLFESVLLQRTPTNAIKNLGDERNGGMNHTFQIEPQRLTFFQKAFLSRKLVCVREGVGLVSCCGMTMKNDRTFLTVTLRTPDPTVFIPPVNGVGAVLELCGYRIREKTDAGMKRWQGRDELACTCVRYCEKPCNGGCGCEACLDAYGAFLEAKWNRLTTN